MSLEKEAAAAAAVGERASERVGLVLFKLDWCGYLLYVQRHISKCFFSHFLVFDFLCELRIVDARRLNDLLCLVELVEHRGIKALQKLR